MARPRKQKEIVEESSPELVDIFIIASCPNPKWKRGVDRKGNKCFVETPRTVAHMLDGKWVVATKIDGADENHYKFVA